MYIGSYDKLNFAAKSFIPITLNAPILVSSTMRKDQGDCIVEPLGSFGVGNLLATSGETSAINPDSIVERKYCEDYALNAKPLVTIVLGEHVIGLVRNYSL